MLENIINCELCGLVCSMQVSASHLRAKHNMTTVEYKELGHKTLSPARLEQLRNTPVAKGKVKRHYGPDHWNWKGGHVVRSGYRVISKRGKTNLYEHRVVMEEVLGRPLESNEVVHHIDGNRANNDPSNLQVMTRKEHDKFKDGVRRHFHTNTHCEHAVVDLYNLGWSKNRIEQAMRIHHGTLKRWLIKHQSSLTR